MLIDSHCHLDPESFEKDDAYIQDLIIRARAAGVSPMITIVASVTKNIATDPVKRYDYLNNPESAGPNTINHNALTYAIKLAEEHDDIYFAAGIHPHEAHLLTDAVLTEYANALKHPKAVALGEIGLDYFYDFSTPDEQRSAFAKQLHLARELNMPVACHIRDAHAEAQTIMAAEYPVGEALIHCFTGTYAEACIYLDRGYYLSAPGVLTCRHSGELRETFKKLPRDRVLLETDSPFLAPIPYRGKANEPAYMIKTAECLADLWDVTLPELSAITVANTKKFYRLK